MLAAVRKRDYSRHIRPVPLLRKPVWDRRVGVECRKMAGFVKSEGAYAYRTAGSVACGSFNDPIAHLFFCCGHQKLRMTYENYCSIRSPKGYRFEISCMYLDRKGVVEVFYSDSYRVASGEISLFFSSARLLTLGCFSAKRGGSGEENSHSLHVRP